MKRRVVLILSIFLASSVLAAKEAPANAFRLWPWHKHQIEQAAPETPKTEIKQEIQIQLEIPPVADVKKSSEEKKEVPVVNKKSKPCPINKPCPKKKTCPVKKPCHK